MSVGPVHHAERLSIRGGIAGRGHRAVPEETAVALSFNGGTHAVMMATPADFADFAVGFGLSEGLIEGPGDIESLDVVETPDGIDLQIWLTADRAAPLIERRRRMAGPTGCGLCGLEMLEDVMRPARRVASQCRFAPRDIAAALAALPMAQALHRETRAVHGAGLWSREAGLVELREDVGRHNALDKLAGALARQGTEAGNGLLLLTSRVSVEMVQKAAVIGVPVIVAVSAPTALALRTAEAAGITLCAIARDDGFEIFTHPHRIAAEVTADVS